VKRADKKSGWECPLCQEYFWEAWAGKLWRRKVQHLQTHRKSELIKFIVDLSEGDQDE